MNSRAVIILSGGMDSTTLLYDLINQKYSIHAVTFDYGQKHKKEISYAIKTCERLKIPQKIIDINILNDLAPSSLTRTDWEVPEGNYADNNMKQTVVPNRNMVLLSLAAAFAIGIKATHLYYGAHSGDHAIYPDCRPSFVSAMATAFHLCDWDDLTLSVPYLQMSKGDIVKRGLSLGVDYSNTWTCYKGEEKSCGKCGSCDERLAAFREAGVDDPLEYQ
ncbi:7-cyano-7-deazaguanine synthase QueC [Methanoregula sp.]|uniref:7-cyano-7-deazaguanine synthase QueC n=1 Tax=Methanoregula sp. TaxID=2052170 RepID=UPI0035678DC6